MRRWTSVTVSVFSLWTIICLDVRTAAAEECAKAGDEIVTDRPDVTNSSLVVPLGALQSENGVNLSAQNTARTIDGTNTRLRLGIAPCLELLVDLPTYVAAVHGSAISGFTDIAPAVKWQISPVPGKVDLSAVVGAALPTGGTSIAGPHYASVADSLGKSRLIIARPVTAIARACRSSSDVAEHRTRPSRTWPGVMHGLERELRKVIMDPFWVRFDVSNNHAGGLAAGYARGFAGADVPGEQPPDTDKPRDLSHANVRPKSFNRVAGRSVGSNLDIRLAFRQQIGAVGKHNGGGGAEQTKAQPANNAIHGCAAPSARGRQAFSWRARALTAFRADVMR